MVDKNITISNEVISQALLNIYRQNFDLRREVEPNLFREILSVVNRATETGYARSHYDPTDKFRRQVEQNNAVWTAFKVHKQQSEMARRMIDSEGNLKPFSKWRKEVMPIADHQNKTWLRTEYNTAVARSHRAADFQRFEAEKDVLPNIQWLKTTSATPGNDHKPFWQLPVILPVDHQFWNEHRPGDRWNCKCSWRATDRKATRGVTLDVPQSSMPQPGLDNNPATDGRIFNDTHPYFPDSCATCPLNGKLSRLFANLSGKQKNCYECHYAKQLVTNTQNAATRQTIAEHRAEFEAYSDKFEKTLFDEQSGGYLVTHVGRIPKKQKGNEWDKFDKEQGMCKVLAKLGYKIKHLLEVPRISSPDITINGIKADLKKTSSHNNIGHYAKHAIKNQNAELVIFEFTTETKLIYDELYKLREKEIKGYYYFTGRENKLYAI